MKTFTIEINPQNPNIYEVRDNSKQAVIVFETENIVDAAELVKILHYQEELRDNYVGE